MAIAFDVASNSGNPGTVASFSWSHTVAAGSDLLLIVGVNMYDATDADRVVSGITYNGVALTQSITLNDDTTDIRSDIWYLKNPTTVANTVEVTMAGTVTDPSAFACSFSGVDQTTPIEATGTFGTDVSPATPTVITVTDNAWTLAACQAKQATAAGCSFGIGTQRYELDTGVPPQAGATLG